MHKKDRETIVRDMLAKFVSENDLNQGDIILARIEKNKSGEFLRGVIDFSLGVEQQTKPKLMRGFEREVRESVEPQFELIADRVRDVSPLRRLSDPSLKPRKKNLKKPSGS